MNNYTRFIEEAQSLFERYKILDSRNDDVIKLNRLKGAYIAIAGEYFLNREWNGEIYQHLFYLVVILDKTGTFDIPIVWMPKEIRPHGFEHLYVDNTCCLGLSHEVRTIWGEEQSASIFFERIVDIFLVNFMSFQINGVCITPERPHGQDGIVDYYKNVLGVDKQCCGDVLNYIYKRVIRKELAKGHNMCPCGSGKIIRKCHGNKFNDFIKSLYNNQERRDAFIHDFKSFLRAR